MIDCKAFDSLIDDYISGGLNAIDRTAVEAHMAQCTSCKIDYAFALRAQKALHSFPVIEAPKDFLDKINARIDEEVPALYTPKFDFRKYQKRIYSAVAACLAFALFLGTKPWSLVKNSNRDIDTPIASFAPIKDNAPESPIEAPVVDETAAPVDTLAGVVTEPTQDVVVAPTAIAQATKAPAIIATQTPVPTATTQATIASTTTPVAKATATVAPNIDDSSYKVSDTTIAVPSDNYVVSDDSDNANYAKIKEKSKLEQSYALAQSLDGDVYSPDVLAKLSQYDNIVVTDPLFIKDGDDIVSLTVSAKDMDSINKALDVFRFSNDGNKYKISRDELKQFLNTLDNLGVKYDLGNDSVKGDTIIELITA